MLQSFANATDLEQVTVARPPLDCLLSCILTSFQHKARSIRHRLLRAWTWTQEPVTLGWSKDNFAGDLKDSREVLLDLVHGAETAPAGSLRIGRGPGPGIGIRSRK